MQTTISLDDNTTQVLERELPSDRVLSVVLDVNPASPANQGGGLRIRAKNLMTQLEAPEALTQVVLDDLSEAERSTRTRTYFLWDEHGHVKQRVVDTQLELPEAAHYGLPNLEPLRFALLSNPRSLIALVDHDWGRLFSVRLGEISELHDLLGLNGGRRIPARNIADDQYEEHQDQVFWNTLVEQLVHLRQTEGFEHLLIAGPPEMRTSLTAELTSDLKGALVGTFHVPGDATAASVLEAAQSALKAAEQNAEEAALEATRERGVRGLETTLSAVQEGGVYELLVAGDGSNLPVWRDEQGYVFGVYPAQGISPLTGLGVEGKTLRDVLGELRERFGLRVRFLRGDLAHQLETEMGGLAGLQRHSNQT
jgi:Bacterial archaeo-eukaryotic release factor family 10